MDATSLVQVLTPEQLDQLRQVMAEAPNREAVAVTLIRLADEWGYDWQDIVNTYGEVIATTRGGKRARVRVPLVLQPEWQEQSSVSHIEAEPDAVGSVGPNFVLIGARERRGIIMPKEIRRMAWECGLTKAIYDGFEQGWRLPTPQQAARLCAFLGLNVEDTFILSGPAQSDVRYQAKTLSMLALLRSARQMTQQDVQRMVYRAYGVAVSRTTLLDIESDHYEVNLSREPEIDALAKYFGVKPSAITKRVSEVLMTKAVANTRMVHQRVKQALSQAMPLMDIKAVGGGPNAILIGDGSGDE